MRMSMPAHENEREVSGVSGVPTWPVPVEGQTSPARTARSGERSQARRRLTNVVEQALHHVEVPVVLAPLLLGRLLEQGPRVAELDLEFVSRRGGRRLRGRHLREVDLEELVRVRDAVLVARVGRGRVGDGG